jgi:co-chaperonin GroES (HSP10)
MTTVLHPKGNRITVLMDEPRTKSEGGIELTGDIRDHLIGTVLEISPTLLLKWEKEGYANRPIDVGNRVLYGRYAGMDAVVGGKNICILMAENDGDLKSEIIGVLEGEGE